MSKGKLEGIGMQHVNGLKLTKIPVKFRDWVDNSDLVHQIYDVFGQDFYLVREDSCRLTPETIAHLLEYYDETFRASLGNDEYITLPINYYPDFSLLESSEALGYDIITVKDELALNFMLSVSCGDNIVSILSSDYEVRLLSEVWGEYYGNKARKYEGINFYDFFSDRSRHFTLRNGTIAWLDTYVDDEDAGHFLEITKMV